MQRQPVRVAGTRVYVGTKDSVQGPPDYPVMQTKSASSHRRSSPDPRPKESRWTVLRSGAFEQCPLAVSVLVEAAYEAFIIL